MILFQNTSQSPPVEGYNLKFGIPTGSNVGTSDSVIFPLHKDVKEFSYAILISGQLSKTKTFKSLVQL